MTRAKPKRGKANRSRSVRDTRKSAPRRPKRKTTRGALTKTFNGVEKFKTGAPTLYEPRFCRIVIEEMEKGFSLGAVAGALRVARSTLTQWANSHVDFMLAVQTGKAFAAQKIGGEFPQQLQVAEGLVHLDHVRLEEHRR